LAGATRTTDRAIRATPSSASDVCVTQFRGSANGALGYPAGVAVDGSGNVYVVDAGNNRVQVFSSAGTYVAQWGAQGSGNGQINTPLGIAVASSGNVYVSDHFNNRIEVFGPPPTNSLARLDAVLQPHVYLPLITNARSACPPPP
jgi:DNA-binding beta-propeller fold protein YncE